MRLIIKIVFLYFCILTQLKAQEIIVVKTRSIPKVEHILNGFQSTCSNKHSITVYDMEGNLSKGREILTIIEDKVDKKNVKSIFTIGLPATQIIQQAITQIPIVFSMVREPNRKDFPTKNITGISKDLPANVQLQTVKRALPYAKRIAIIYSQNYSEEKANQLFNIANEYDLTINLYQVFSVKEIPKTLRRVIIENDALILLPDQLVINQTSLQYFISTVVENGFPTLSYNQFLVKSGILMGVSPNYSSMGKQAGNLLCSDKNAEQKFHSPKKFQFFINSKTANKIKIPLPNNFIELADHVY